MMKFPANLSFFTIIDSSVKILFMPKETLSEIYFIAGMMILILIICTAATYLFFRTYYAEKAQRERELIKRKQPEKINIESPK